MPIMGGLRASQEIRASLSPHLQPYICALTGELIGVCSRLTIARSAANSMQEDKDGCLNAGMNDFLSKPVRIDALTRLLASCPRLAINVKATTAASAVSTQ